MDTRLFAFVGGDIGLWRIVGTETIVGKPLPEAKRLNVISASELQPETNAPWVLRGITSNERYVMRGETEKSQADLAWVASRSSQDFTDPYPWKRFFQADAGSSLR